jgi:hypothetical protein
VSTTTLATEPLAASRVAELTPVRLEWLAVTAGVALTLSG